MGSVRKMTYTCKQTGKKKKTLKYYCCYTGHDGRQDRRDPIQPSDALSGVIDKPKEFPIKLKVGVSWR